MPIFGLCPAYDEFYLVMCSHCNQVIKPQAFQSHYERRHGSVSKTPITPPSTSAFPLYSTVSSKTKPSGGGCSSTRTSTGSSASSNSKLMKSPKEKLQLGGSNRSIHPVQHSKAPQEKTMTPPVKVEKIHANPKMDGVLKSTAGPACSSTVSSSIKTGLNCPSIPKPPLPSPGQIPNGKGILSTTPFLEKKPEDTNNRKYLYKRLSDREFDPDIHCGVVDVETKKPCTRSLTCKTHSLGYRRAVQGRKKRFDVLLAEHKNKSREKEFLRHPDHQQQALREPHPLPSKSSQELHQNSHGLTAPETKLSVPNKAKPHNPSLPRAFNHPAPPVETPLVTPPPYTESPQPVVSAAEPISRYLVTRGKETRRGVRLKNWTVTSPITTPDQHPYCTLGRPQLEEEFTCLTSGGITCDVHLTSWFDKHLILRCGGKSLRHPAIRRHTPPHRTSTSSTPSSHGGNSANFLSPSSVTSPSSSAASPCTSLDKVLSHGTTLNAHTAPTGASDSVSSMQSRQCLLPHPRPLCFPPYLPPIPTSLKS
ncbi:hypothetical protein GDO86_007091 [Hymenochirus boettgeri]|uniref:SCA7 domain-containing protein n=1 Tax=Hymenochirus boettgeri TaxID=247094 RepID=A0A8T2J0F5_9PIPI|nr:hypothetical protein GDO86_007091 [Hymenochirus boettgeri]